MYVLVSNVCCVMCYLRSRLLCVPKQGNPGLPQFTHKQLVWSSLRDCLHIPEHNLFICHVHMSLL